MVVVGCDQNELALLLPIVGDLIHLRGVGWLDVILELGGGAFSAMQLPVADNCSLLRNINQTPRTVPIVLPYLRLVSHSYARQLATDRRSSALRMETR